MIFYYECVNESNLQYKVSECSTTRYYIMSLPLIVHYLVG